MRWDDGGDDGAEGGDDVDDDPDDARHDGDGGDCPLREGNSPTVFSLLELFFALSGFRLAEAAEKLFVDTPDGFRSKGSVAPRPRNYTQILCNPQAMLHNRRLLGLPLPGQNLAGMLGMEHR